MNNKNNSFSKTEVLILLVIVSVTTCVMTYLIVKGTSTNKYSKDLKEFMETYDFILDNYYDEIDKTKLENGAIKGLLEATGDKYTTYLDDSQSNTVDVMLEGSYEGLGIQIANTTDGEHIILTGIVNDSPASSSDLELGDEIIKINDTDFKGKTTTELVNFIKENKESKFVVRVLRGEEELDIDLERKYIVLKSVESEVFESNDKTIGYIYISLFANNTDSQFKLALKELEEKNIDSLIIDVRDNSGGHLTSVSNMISEFVDSSYIIYNMEDNGVITPTYSTGSTTKTYPIVILINNNSASASEVLAGSLKDNLNAYLIGETSYGKGTVQQLLTLSNGDYYKVTTQKWLTPKETWVNEKGLEPDLDVKLSSDYDGTNETDNQLQEAINYLLK